VGNGKQPVKVAKGWKARPDSGWDSGRNWDFAKMRRFRHELRPPALAERT
jgi:hypothetical protein